MQSKFSIRGHPFHPILVTIPIGLFTWAFAADVIYLLTDKNKMWYDISLYSGGFGVIAALAAALPGFGDYFTMAIKSRIAAMATAHMLLNLALVGVFGGAFLLQMDNGALTGGNLTLLIALHAVGMALLGASGVLGGEMVYRHHLAVVPSEGEAAAEHAAIEQEVRRREPSGTLARRGR
jgi:uncharacterized membrane protein